MKYYSTKRLAPIVSFKEAVVQGLPEDNGLYYPESIPLLSDTFLKELPTLSLPEIGFEVMKHFTGDDLSKEVLLQIVTETLNFDIPVRLIHDNIHVLELFHGPTLAFKDIGARFLARCLGQFSLQSETKSVVLVATSGDTGSAVANGFYGVDNVEVIILYPKEKVSFLQEQQLTTLGGNITALEVEGTFDDCQHMVKSAFLDKEVRDHIALTSANSINIARLLPQSLYYFWAVAQLEGAEDIVFSVPSGNYGNLTAGLFAKAMGLPIKAFVASSNINDIVPHYLKTAIFDPRPSQQTISNAMDVGNPSNFPRILEIYGHSWDAMKADIKGFSYTDDQTRDVINQVNSQYHYLLDTHGAVGYLGLQDYMKNSSAKGVFLETAHPAKFKDVIIDIVGEVAVPDRLAIFANKEKKSKQMSSEFNDLKAYLLNPR